MSSELHGSSGADRPDSGADQPGESRDDPFQRVPRDVNAVPASAGWKPDSGISRADYYPDFGKPGGETPGQQQAADTQRGTEADGLDAHHAGTAGLDSGAGDDTGAGPDGQLEGSGSVHGGAGAQEAPAETAGAGGDPPYRGPDGDRDVPGDPLDPGFTPDWDRWAPHDGEPANGPGTVFGRDGVIDAGPSAGIRETGGEDDERGDAGAARKTRPEAPEQPRQGDSDPADEAATRTDGSAEDQESSDQPGERDQGGEQTRERVQPVQEAHEESAPEAAADQRMDAFEQRIQSMMEQKLQEAIDGVKAEMKADYETKLDAQKAEQEAKYEAQIESIKADYDAKFDELEAKVEGGPPDADASSDRKPDSEEDPDVSGAEQRGDRLAQGVKDPEQVPDDSFDAQDQGAELYQHEGTDQGTDAKQDVARQADSPKRRRIFTAENVSAASTVGGALNMAVELFGHASPEGMVGLGLTLLGVAGMGMAKMEKRRKEQRQKNDRPD